MKRSRLRGSWLAGALQFLRGLMSYFSPREFECKCSRLDCDAPAIDSLLVARLNLLRECWGCPIHINSGVRCREHNAAVGGAPDSLHMQGLAVDMSVGSRAEADQLAELCVKMGFGGIGTYSRWVHADLGPKRRWTGS